MGVRIDSQLAEHSAKRGVEKRYYLLGGTCLLSDRQGRKTPWVPGTLLASPKYEQPTIYSIVPQSRDGISMAFGSQPESRWSRVVERLRRVHPHQVSPGDTKKRVYVRAGEPGHLLRSSASDPPRAVTMRSRCVPSSWHQQSRLLEVRGKIGRLMAVMRPD